MYAVDKFDLNISYGLFNITHCPTFNRHTLPCKGMYFTFL